MLVGIKDADLFINNIGPHKYQLVLEQELIEFASMDSKAPDSDWTTIDNQGHFHTFADDDSLPTLEMHIEEEPEWHRLVNCNQSCDAIHSSFPVSYYRCRLCKDAVAPHFMSSWTKNEAIPGRKSASITVEHFGQNVEIGETVSWYNKTHFGTGKVMSIHLKTGVELLIACDYMAKRKNVDL